MGDRQLDEQTIFHLVIKHSMALGRYLFTEFWKSGGRCHLILSSCHLCPRKRPSGGQEKEFDSGFAVAVDFSSGRQVPQTCLLVVVSRCGLDFSALPTGPADSSFSLLRMTHELDRHVMFVSALWFSRVIEKVPLRR